MSFLPCKLVRPFFLAAVVMLTATCGPVPAQDKVRQDLPPELAVVPHDAFAFLYLRPAELWQCEPAARLRKAFPLETAQLLKATGEDPMETESFTIVFPSPGAMGYFVPNLPNLTLQRPSDQLRRSGLNFTPSDLDKLTIMPPQKAAPTAADLLAGILVVETTVKPLDRADVVERVLGKGAVVHKHKNRTYYTNKEQSSYLGALYLVNDRTYLYAFTAETLKKALTDMDRPPVKSPLQDALDLARQKHHVVVGVNTGHADSDKQRKEWAAQWSSSLNDSVPTWAMVPLLEMRSAAVCLDVGKDLRLQADVRFPDAKQAEKAAGPLQDAVLMTRLLAGALSRLELQRELARGENGQVLVLLDLLLPQLEKSLRKVVVERNEAALSVKTQMPLNLEILDDLDFHGDFACIHVRVADLLRGEGAAQLVKLFPRMQKESPLRDLVEIGLPLENLDTATIVIPSSRQMLGGFRVRVEDFENLKRIDDQLPKEFENRKKEIEDRKKPEDKKADDKDGDGKQADGNEVAFRQGAPAAKAAQQPDAYDFLLEDAVIVKITTLKPYDRLKVMKGLLGQTKELKHKGKAYYVTLPVPDRHRHRSEAVHFVDERTLLIVSSQTAMPAVLDRSDLFRGRPALVDALETAKKKHQLAVALNFNEASIVDLRKLFAAELQGRAREGRGDPFELELAQAVLPLLDMRTLVLGADAGKDVSVRAEATFASPQQAAERKKSVQDALDLGRIFLLSRGQAEFRSQARDLLRSHGPGPLLFGDAVLVPAERPVLIPDNDLRPLLFISELLGQAEVGLRKVTLEQRGAAVHGSAQTRFDVAALNALAFKDAQTIVKNDEPDRLVRTSAANMRKLVDAMQNYADVHGKAPVSGKLSWRVHLLPFLDELALYQEFRQDEAWDSPHNVKLLPRMPKIFAPPGLKTKEPFTTHYQVFTGPGTIFDPKLKFPSNDGIAIVEAFAADAWTKPTDIAYDAKKPLPKLGGVFPHGFHIAYVSGNVRFLTEVREAFVRSQLIVRPQGKGDIERFDK